MSSEKQWYAVYTRHRWEKKVADQLSKKSIENYCPLNRVVRQWSDRKKIIHEPLFTSYVFVHVLEHDHAVLKQTPGIINLVHWLKKPAVIRDADIELIRRFLNQHTNVKVERTQVLVNDLVKVINGPLMEYEGQVIAVKNNTVKLVLPSLGYMMSAEVETSNVKVISNKPEAENQSSSNLVLGI